MPHSPQLPDPADDPWLPFVIAARGGDEGAEREFLVRISPIVLDVVRATVISPASEQDRLALDALITTLKALPTFRGDEWIAVAVAKITLASARRAGHTQTLPDAAVLTAARARARRGARATDHSRITSLVDAALADDAAVLVSHIVRRAPERRKVWSYIAVAVVLTTVVVSAYWSWAR